MCEWLVYIFVAVSILTAILTIYQELQLKVMNLKAENTLPSEHRGAHRSILRWFLRQNALPSKPGVATSLTRVAVSNRGNVIAVPLLSVFTKSTLRQLVTAEDAKDRFLLALAGVCVPAFVAPC